MKIEFPAALAGLVLLGAAACSPLPGAVAPPGSALHAEKEHAHLDEAGGDLERTEEELFAARCEHDLPAHQCALCRYSVGVVRVPPALVEEGLIQLATVERQQWETVIGMTGEISFDERLIAHLSPQAEGVIHRVLVTLGQAVAKGQPLLEIDSPVLGQAQSAYREARAAAVLARSTFKRQQEMLDLRITSQREYQAAAKEDEESRIREQAALDNLARLGLSAAEIASLDERASGRAPGRLVLRAPFAGLVLEMDAVPGEFVQPGPTTVLIGDLSRLWVLADLLERDLAAVLERGGKDLPARVTVNAFPGEEFSGRLEVVGATMDEDTRTVKVRLSLANPASRLRPGMFARVEIDLPSARSGMGVPRTAVASDEGIDFVFRHHAGDYFIRRKVKTGQAQGPLVEILEGLTPGQTVVADGSFLLKSDVLRSKMGAGCAD